MGRAIPLLVAVLVVAATPAAASAHPLGVDGARLRKATTPVHHTAPVQHQSDAFTLVEAQNGAVVRSRPRGDRGRAPGPDAARDDHLALGRQDFADGRWAQVVLPWRPNGRTGWISLRGRRTVKSPIWVEADVSRRRVNLMRGSRVMRSFVAAVGAPGLPHAGRPLQRHRPDRHRRPRRAVRLVRVRALGPPAQPAGRLVGRRPARHPRHERALVARDGRLRRLPARLVDRARHPQALPAPGDAGHHRGVVARREVGYPCLTGRGAAW